jgi:[ribosomal protein S5]-alanine N-acetyltransferase
VAPATAADIASYVIAVEQSQARIARFGPADPHALAGLVGAQSPTHCTLLVHAREPEGAHDLVGKVSVTSIVLGRALMGSLGYDAFDPYAGRGLFREGLALAVDVALGAAPYGLGLHRVEALVQPHNVRSAALLRSLGFTPEGRSRRILRLPGPDGIEGWRDHDRFAVLAEDWRLPH